MNKLLLLLLFLPIIVYSQSTFTIEGYVLNSNSKPPLPYVNVYNTTLEKVTITNTDGYFQIPINTINDSIFFTYIGFEKKWLAIKNINNSHLIYLNENSQILDEVAVTATDYSYLFDFLKECKKNRIHC